MKVKCPKCKAIYKLDPEKIQKEKVKIKCKKCAAIFAVKMPPKGEQKREEVPVSKPAAPPPPLPPRKIVLGIEDTNLLEQLSSLIEKRNCTVKKATDGVKVLDILSEEKPDIIILDVVLPKVFGFEIVEILRKRENMKDVKMILVGAYEGKKYVRTGENKYGADLIVEAKDLKENPDTMLSKILGEKEPQSGPPSAPPSQAEMKEEVKPPPAPEFKKEEPVPPQEEPEEKQAVPPKSSQMSATEFMAQQKREIEEEFKDLSPEERQSVEKAKRLARLIVSDILLYNPDKVEQGIKSGNFYSILEKDIEDGKKLYRERVPAWVRERWDFLNEELEKMIERKKKEYGIQ